MKKLLTMLFTFMVAFSLAMPVFAQDTGGGEAKATKAKKTKATKTKKTKATKATSTQ